MTALTPEMTILLPAFLAGLLVLTTHVPLGQQVLARGIIFLDLAVAQIAGLGVIAAHSFGWTPGGWMVQVVAASAAVTGALLLYQVERALPAIQEAIIGTVFVLAATGGVLLLAADPRGSEHLRDLLAGQILWISYTQLAWTAAAYAVLGLGWYAIRRRAPAFSFYMVFALAVTLSVQLVGVLLVFASLILPALAVHRLSPHRRLATGYLVGTVGYSAGIGTSAWLDLPTGAVIVWALAIIAGFVAVVIRRSGY
jgi:zinc/manganese transport system permease protein